MSAMHGPVSILPLVLDGVRFAVGGNDIINDVSLELRARSCTVILGPNGAGKSVLLRLCHGLLQPSGGNIRWSGPQPRLHQAMVFQRPVMLRRSTRANIVYALKRAGVPRGERHRRADDALRTVGLAGLAERSARVLSGGEQQRVALARAWALRPEVLFLDEPTASLDPAATRAIEETIATIRAAGTKVIMTTHDLGQARRLADEVIFIHHGHVLEHTPAEAFFSAPTTHKAAAYLKGELLL
jgi:tungstate transport system ATP-binding protein